MSFLLNNLYNNYTTIIPSYGGSYIEGIIGQPRFINPIYSEASDIDRDLTEIIFSGLISYDESGVLKKDLAEKYEISEDGKIYEFTLKEDIFWHDGNPITSKDVIFTIETIQNPDYKSPKRANWLGIEMEEVSERKIRFYLNSPYKPFLENCTFKIIPEHIWKNISLENFPLTFYNLRPIGSGPYQFDEIKQNDEGFIEYINLKSYQNYHRGKPFISSVSFYFFKNQEELMRSNIDGVSFSDQGSYSILANGHNLHSYSLPRYFAVFFNHQNRTLREKEIRKAMVYSSNKEKVLEELGIANSSVNSPILPTFFGYEEPEKYFDYNLEKAEEILKSIGFEKNEIGVKKKVTEKQPAFQFKSILRVGSQGDEVRELQKCLSDYPDIYSEGKVTGYFGEETKAAVMAFQDKYADEILAPSGLTSAPGHVGPGTRNKLNEICSPPSEEVNELNFVLVTTDQEHLIVLAEKLKEEWKKIGINIKIEPLSLSEIRTTIREREYDLLLFGQALGSIPDPFPFWHSSQRTEPGLNLSAYENEDVDVLLEETRKSIDKDLLEDFQEILIKDFPALFLYSPNYTYAVSEKIKGIEGDKIINPSKRFSNIEKWYINTKRSFR